MLEEIAETVVYLMVIVFGLAVIGAIILCFIAAAMGWVGGWRRLLRRV